MPGFSQQEHACKSNYMRRQGLGGRWSISLERIAQAYVRTTRRVGQHAPVRDEHGAVDGTLAKAGCADTTRTGNAPEPPSSPPQPSSSSRASIPTTSPRGARAGNASKKHRRRSAFRSSRHAPSALTALTEHKQFFRTHEQTQQTKRRVGASRLASDHIENNKFPLVRLNSAELREN